MNKAIAFLRGQWERRSARERLIAIGCALVVGGALLTQALVLPYVSYLDRLDSQIQAKEIQLAKYRRWLKTSAGNAAMPALSDQTLGSLNEDMSRLLKDLEALARESGVRIVDLKPLPGEARGIHRRMGVDLQLEAGLLPLTAFLYKVQTAGQLFEVNRFQIFATDGPFLRASLLILQTRFLPPGTKSPATRSDGPQTLTLP